MTNFYIVVTEKENDKCCSYVLKINKNDNLLAKLKINKFISAYICSTKKEAYEKMGAFNNLYKQNGTYMFDLPAF